MFSHIVPARNIFYKHSRNHMNIWSIVWIHFQFAVFKIFWSCSKKVKHDLGRTAKLFSIQMIIRIWTSSKISFAKPDLKFTLDALKLPPFLAMCLSLVILGRGTSWPFQQTTQKQGQSLSLRKASSTRNTWFLNETSCTNSSYSASIKVSTILYGWVVES